MTEIYMSLDDIHRLNRTIFELSNSITELRVPFMTNVGMTSIVITNNGETISSHPDFFTTARWADEDSEVSINGEAFDGISMVGYYNFTRENSFGDFGDDEPQQKPTLKQLLEERE